MSWLAMDLMAALQEMESGSRRGRPCLSRDSADHLTSRVRLPSASFSLLRHAYDGGLSPPQGSKASWRCRGRTGAPCRFSTDGFLRPALRTGRTTLTASGSPCAHTVGVLQRFSFVCIASTRDSAPIGPSHEAPVFTSVLLALH